MGLALPQLAPASLDRVSGTQIIDGSLKIASQSDTLGSYLSRTPVVLVIEKLGLGVLG